MMLEYILCYSSAFFFGVIVGVAFMLYLDYRDAH